MDPVENPFAPGAGTRPPQLAGRDDLLNEAKIAFARISRGRHARSMILIGLRGVGKTVLLDRMRREADSEGLLAIRMEAPEGRSLPSMLAPRMREILIRLSKVEKARELAKRAQRGLAGFVRAFKLQYKDIQVSLDFDPEPGLADNGDLEGDLSALFEAVGLAAQAAELAVIILIDELQYVEESQLAALITALHRSSQDQLPIVLVGAGLPQLPGQLGKAKSYAERLFTFPRVGPLDEESANAAIRIPVEERGGRIEENALAEIFARTEGYPYFLQEWGKHAWDQAPASPIRLEDVREASDSALAALDSSFFQVRLDRLTGAEKQYLRAMAELGAGPHRSGEVARVLSRKQESLGPARARLIHKGMAWSPQHGEIAFTVPHFDRFMKRVIPNLEDMA